MLRLLAMTALASAAASADVAVLYGVTADGDLVTIDVETGAATFVAEVGVAGSLSYDPQTDRLAALVGPGEPGSLVLIDPDSGSGTTPVPIVGLPPGQQKTGGIGYDGTEQGLVVTFGQSGTVFENRVALIDSSGTAVMLSPDLGTGDNDGLFWDAFNDRLLVNDFNANDGFARLASVVDVFSTPVVTAVANPPSNNNAGDAAADPDSGRIFLAEVGPNGGTLLEVVGDSYVAAGPFNTTSQVVGIAFRPAPGCPADLAEPFGELNFFDLAAYLALFNAQDPGADLAAPFGAWNFFDVAAYLTLYNAGCP